MPRRDLRVARQLQLTQTPPLSPLAQEVAERRRPHRTHESATVARVNRRLTYLGGNRHAAFGPVACDQRTSKRHGGTAMNRRQVLRSVLYGVTGAGIAAAGEPEARAAQQSGSS